jgi:hypothetical protein
VLVKQGVKKAFIPLEKKLCRVKIRALYSRSRCYYVLIDQKVTLQKKLWMTCDLKCHRITRYPSYALLTLERHKTLEIPFFFSYLFTFSATSIVINKQEGCVNVLSRSRAHEIIVVLYY